MAWAGRAGRAWVKEWLRARVVLPSSCCSVRVLHVASGQPVHTEGAISVLHCLDGMITVGDERLGDGDSSYGPGDFPASAVSDSIIVQVSVR